MNELRVSVTQKEMHQYIIVYTSKSCNFGKKTNP